MFLVSPRDRIAQLSLTLRYSGILYLGNLHIGKAIRGCISYHTFNYFNTCTDNPGKIDNSKVFPKQSEELSISHIAYFALIKAGKDLVVRVLNINQETPPVQAIVHGPAEHKPLPRAYAALTPSCRLGLLEIPLKPPEENHSNNT
ncbi:hypothetical protein DUI87_21287 [Hirundo rustica rustica]|uniref:Uncharacterized protein n=1 Tax=Hirundo rustica rustica TaxID=333673 RepID=A0A3M0JSP9_HIRRU|nr:hypothetical protein DUI87_21287 [Hirundo rustica rustica]